MKYTPILLPAVRRMLEERRGSWPQIAEDTGVKYRTLQNIAQGKVDNPAVGTIELLHHYLSQSPADSAA